MNNTVIWTRGFIFSCISCFLLFGNFYMFLAAMPLAVKQLMGGSARDMSLVVSVYLLGIVLLRPFSGVLVDRYGKRLVSLVTIGLFTIFSFCYLGVYAIVPLLCIRFFHGITHALSTTGHAAMAIDMLPSEKKGEGIGYYGLAMSLSMVVGPALGLLLLESYGYNYLILTASVLALLSYLFTLLIPNKSKQEIGNEVTGKLKISNFIEVKAIPVCIAALFFSFSYSSLISFIAVYTTEKDLAIAGVYFFVIVALGILITRPLIGKLLDRKGASFLIFPALILFSLGILCLSMANSIWLIWTLAFILGIAYGAIFPSFQTITVRLSPANRTGVATATFFLFYDLGFGLGAFVLAMIANMYNCTMMYQVVSVISMVSLILYYLLYHRPHRVGH